MIARLLLFISIIILIVMTVRHWWLMNNKIKIRYALTRRRAYDTGKRRRLLQSMKKDIHSDAVLIAVYLVLITITLLVGGMLL